MKEDDDLDFRRSLAEYDDLSGPDAVNPKMAGVTLDMQDGHDDYGIQHAWLKHGVGEEIVRQVLFEVPEPEEKGRGMTLHARCFGAWLGTVGAARSYAATNGLGPERPARWPWLPPFGKMNHSGGSDE